MKIYKTQKEIEADIKDGVLKVDGDVRFECSFFICAKLEIAGDISAQDIRAQDISAQDIRAQDISAQDISAWNISARNISARNISFYGCCYAYAKFVCKFIIGRRKNSRYFSLDGEVKIKPDKTEETLSGKIVEVKIDGKEYKAQII